MTLDRASRNSDSATLRRRMIILVVIVLAALDVGAAVWIGTERAEALRIATTSAVNTSRLLSSAVEAQLGAIDKVLIGAAELISFQREERRRGNGAILAFLKRQVELVPGARAILVIGADGKTFYGTNLSEPFGPVDLSDRPYISHHMTDRSQKPYLSTPIRSRNDGSWIVALSRRLEAPDGSFAGVIAATIDLRQLAKVTATASPGRLGSVALVDLEGTILARSPDHQQFVGHSIATLPAFLEGRDKEHGDGIIVSPLDGRVRLFGSTRGSDFPLISVVSRDHDDVLADWRTQSAALAMAGIVVNIMVIALLTRLLRQLALVEQSFDQLARARQAADTANQAKSAFLANMSHEFRTPLNAILGFSDALMTGFPGHSCQDCCHDYLGHVQSSGLHMLSLVNDILDLSKIEVGKADLERAEVDLGALAGNCVAIVNPKADEKDLRLTLDIRSQSPAFADPRRIRQIILNLLSNAIKFTPDGGSITLTLTESADAFHLAVSDNGIGMSESEVETALTPFGQNVSDIARSEAGTGLGLPLAKRLAELHGGNLTVFSVKGERTTVTLDLPKA
ncbi:sensor histidine kinase [Paramagnetospirillum kuznetsovii]|nr:ATP-binding protein [Paramagnetospirillum kuznetsovii]